VPSSLTIQRWVPSVVSKMDWRSAEVPLARAIQFWPSVDSRIVPFSPTAHRWLPSAVPKMDWRSFVVPLLRADQKQ
jgi:hypothetical protein